MTTITATTTTATTEAQIRDLEQRWAEAEVRRDVAALEALSSDDFTLVGPLGFVLDPPAA